MVAVAVIVASACSTTRQPPSYYVSGKVRSSNSLPVDGAQGIILIEGDSERYGSWSNADGTFRIPDLPLGRVATIRCTRDGYRYYERSVVISDPSESIDIVLQPAR